MKCWLWLLVALLLGCGAGSPTESANRFYRSIRKVKTQHTRQTTFPSVTLPDSQLRLIQTATEAREIFPVDHWVMLEMTDRSLLGAVSEIIEVEDNWVVLDRITNRILKFDGEGAFLGLIGTPGLGPGEYLNCGNITRVLGDKIAVRDSTRGMVLVYDLEGNFIRGTPQPGTTGDGGKFIITGGLLWDRLDRFYLSDFSVDSATVPQHVVLDYTQEHGKLLFGFGDREAFYQEMVNRYHVPRSRIAAFVSINGRIWSASPNTSEIIIYEPNGALYRKIAGSHPDYIIEEDFQDIEPSKDGLFKLLLNKMHNYKILAFENIVIQYLSGGKNQRFNIFDLNGNLLRSALKVDFLSSMTQTSTDIYVVGTLSDLPELEYYQKAMSEDEMQLLTETGWTVEKSQDSNPVLCLRRPSW